jgi:hypothetical protein
VNNKTNSILLAIVTVIALAAAAVGYYSWSTREGSHTQFVASTLGAAATLLHENQTLIKELQSASLGETDAGILPAYLAKIRRDGVAKHADMKQRLDTLAENNTMIVALIKAYAPHAKASGFTMEADKFGNYASAWRDRWNSVMELFMAGGNYAASGVPFPAGFPAAVDAEIAAAK